MRRVVFNRKGGVGKSSITVNLAAISAAGGRKTLVVDLDPQCNASQYLLGMQAYGHDNGPTPNIGTFFSQSLSFKLKEKAPRDYVHTTRFENLYLLPSDAGLGEIEHLLESKHKIYKLRGLLKSLSREFDEIYVDTPPAFNFYTLSALIAADRVLIPFDCDAFSRKALYTLLENIQEVREDHNEDLMLEGIVVNQFQPRARLPQELVASLEEEGLPMLASRLSASVAMRESHELATPLVNWNPRHKLTEEYLALFRELAAR
ncbi:ParA family protein [Alloalcanivorax gelatiniphagus]|uniref:ParA family protein n=1 Tax=Alloalcanivorax gelatiniphagus TaxID=1194167 RepID=A0ABY2XN63_9GAMM|nr:ParA family protein [Alloalcanivorax gelatiniphagus]TMW13848.1 ParA family protein [Alloalcanivorax gelatiniphagus]|tara:strand:+ start:6744 stop:7526 length:783 start_codon:yes stop_codon:yes gene_type:complete